jgi:ribosomal protein L24
MPIYRSGDIVRVKEGIHAGKEFKVLEIKGSVLMLEGSDGNVTELFVNQVQKQMLFG